MKARHQLAGWSRSVAPALLAACVGVPGVALAASGGTIQITGMIVAPPFDIYQGAGAPQKALLTVSNDRARLVDHAVTVTYAAEPNSAPVADVSLVTPVGANSESHATTQMPVDARFMDGAGHSLTLAEGRGYHVNGTGGVLTLVPRRGSTPDGAALVTVVTSYQ